MSCGSAAGAGKRAQRKSDSPGDEGASCGTCRRIDTSQMVQCDECDVWHHYSCVNVDNSIQDRDWSCNKCMRTSLENQRRALSDQMEHLEQQQKQWQREQQKRLEQMDEQQELEQQQKLQELRQRKQEQFGQLLLGPLQLQQPISLSRAAAGREVPSTSFGVIPKQHQQQVKIMELGVSEALTADERRHADPLASSTTDNVRLSGRSDKASSKSSRRSIKLRELQAKALEARQALEKRQLEEQLALEREMLEVSDSELESISSLDKINEWLESTDKAGKELGNAMDGTPLPVYDALLQKPIVTPTIQTYFPGCDTPFGPSSHQNPIGNATSPQPCLTSQKNYSGCASGVKYNYPRVSGNIPKTVATPQPMFNGCSVAVMHPPSMPVYTVASHQPIISTVYPEVNYPHPAVSISQNVGAQPMITSNQRPNPAFCQQQYQPQQCCDPVSLSNNHLAARQTVKDLPKFGGDPEDWPRFIAAYERTSRMCAFRNDELLDRLERSLQDKALNAVKSLLLHPDNVPVIMNRLKTLFGNAEFIIETMIRRIRLMPPPKADKLETIIDFGVAVQNLCATIQVCQMDERLYNVALLQELVDSLPSTLKMQWAFYCKNIGTATMLDFNNWLGEMVEVLSQVIRPATWNKPQKLDSKSEKQGRREQAYVHVHSSDNSEQEDIEACLACGNDCSTLDVCNNFLEMSTNARWALVNKKKICRRCLTRHFEACDRKIPCNQNGCNFLHHRLLHDDKKHKLHLSNDSTQNVSCNTHHCSEEGVLLKYIPVTVYGKGKSISTYAFFDAGSTSTLMDHSLWEELNIEGKKLPLNISWTDGQQRREADSVVCSAKIGSSTTSNQTYLLPEVHTVRNLDLPVQSLSAESLAKNFLHLSNIPIESYTEVKPRILLGVKSSRLENPLDCREGDENQPTAVLTRLGWVVYGPCPVSRQAMTTGNVSSTVEDNTQATPVVITNDDEHIEKLPQASMDETRYGSLHNTVSGEGNSKLLPGYHAFRSHPRTKPTKELMVKEGEHYGNPQVLNTEICVTEKSAQQGVHRDPCTGGECYAICERASATNKYPYYLSE